MTFATTNADGPVETYQSLPMELMAFGAIDNEREWFFVSSRDGDPMLVIYLDDDPQGWEIVHD